MGANDHSEEGDDQRLVDLNDARVSTRYRSHCRPPTGTASKNCQPATGATVSIMNRTFTSRSRDQSVTNTPAHVLVRAVLCWKRNTVTSTFTRIASLGGEDSNPQ